MSLASPILKVCWNHLVLCRHSPSQHPLFYKGGEASKRFLLLSDWQVSFPDLFAQNPRYRSNPPHLASGPRSELRQSHQAAIRDKELLIIIQREEEKDSNLGTEWERVGGSGQFARDMEICMKMHRAE